MTGVECESIMQWEQTLLPGAPVTACWTSCYSAFRVPAEVVKVNAKTVRIRLKEDIHRAGRIAYPAGREFSVPRLFNKRWSACNRVAPEVSSA